MVVVGRVVFVIDRCVVIVIVKKSLSSSTPSSLSSSSSLGHCRCGRAASCGFVVLCWWFLLSRCHDSKQWRMHQSRSVADVSARRRRRRHRVEPRRRRVEHRCAQSSSCRRCRRKGVRGPVTLIVSVVVGHRCWPVLVVVGIVVVVPSSSSLCRQ